jgi:hypothetical protein
VTGTRTSSAAQRGPQEARRRLTVRSSGLARVGAMFLRRTSRRERANKYWRELSVSLFALRWLIGLIGRHARA